MSELGILINEVKHIGKSLSGLHRKANKTNGRLTDHEGRLMVLEKREVVTTAQCAEVRGATWKRIAFIVIGALIATAVGFFGPLVLNTLLGGVT